MNTYYYPYFFPEQSRTSISFNLLETHMLSFSWAFKFKLSIEYYSIVTRLWPGWLRFTSWEGRILLFATTSTLALGPTNLPIQWVPEFFTQRLSGQGTKLTTGTQLVLRLRMHGAILPFPYISACHDATWTTLPLPESQYWTSCQQGLLIPFANPIL